MGVCDDCGKKGPMINEMRTKTHGMIVGSGEQCCHACAEIRMRKIESEIVSGNGSSRAHSPLSQEEPGSDHEVYDFKDDQERRRLALDQADREWAEFMDRITYPGRWN